MRQSALNRFRKVIEEMMSECPHMAGFDRQGTAQRRRMFLCVVIGMYFCDIPDEVFPVMMTDLESATDDELQYIFTGERVGQ